MEFENLVRIAVIVAGVTMIVQQQDTIDRLKEKLGWKEHC